MALRRGITERAAIRGVIFSRIFTLRHNPLGLLNFYSET
jgi:hypothetical protein